MRKTQNLLLGQIIQCFSSRVERGKYLSILLVHIEKDDGEVLVSESRFSMHASAPTLQEAIAEFKRILVDELGELTKDEGQLGPRLQAQLHYLRSMNMAKTM